MKNIKLLLFFLTATAALFILVPTSRSQTAPDSAELTKLLQDFLAGAGRNDVAMHDRFWADELIYTSAKGRRKTKPEIMRELQSEAQPEPAKEETIYTAEEIQIRQFGDTAVVAFRLVATTNKNGAKEISNYLNTGTFLKRGGKWQAVGWQATALPDAAQKTS